MGSIPPTDLHEQYRGWLDIAIDEDGVSVPHGLVREVDGSLTVYALALPPRRPTASC